MGPQIMHLASQGLGMEIIYSFVIIACSLIIYFSTKQLYELSDHKGIKYFRLSFLFFAVAYFFRSFIKFILIYFDIGRILDFNPMSFYFGFGQFTLFVFVYLSSMAMFYLLYSVMWKKWQDSSDRLYLFHIIALGVGLVSVATKNGLVHLGVNLFLLVLALSVVYIASKKSKPKNKKHSLYVIYILLSIFWVLNIVDVLVPDFVQSFQILVYLASLGIFMTITYKVLIKLGPR